MIEVVICNQDAYDENQKEDTYICKSFTISHWGDKEVVIDFLGLTSPKIDNEYSIKCVPVDIEKMIIMVAPYIENF